MKTNRIGLKSKILSTYIISLALTVVVLAFFYTKADAISLSLTVDPTIIRIRATPPADISTSLVIQNLDTEPITLKTILKPFIPSEKENGEIKYLISDTSLSTETNFLQSIKLYDEDKLLSSSFVLAPKQRKKLILKLNIPKDYTNSDYYFSVIFLSAPEEKYESNQSYISGGVVSNILLSIGKAKAQGEIEEFNTPAFVKSGPITFDVKIKNKSKNFITPQGRILIKNMFGQTVGNINLTPTNILSNSSRFITNRDQVSKNSSQHENDSEKPKVFWPNSFIIGYYTAELTLSLSDQGPILTKTIHFFAFPIKAVIILIILLTIFIFVANRIKNKRKNS